jgi:hypothetical protein
MNVRRKHIALHASVDDRHTHRARVETGRHAPVEDWQRLKQRQEHVLATFFLLAARVE